MNHCGDWEGSPTFVSNDLDRFCFRFVAIRTDLSSGTLSGATDCPECGRRAREFSRQTEAAARVHELWKLARCLRQPRLPRYISSFEIIASKNSKRLAGICLYHAGMAAWRTRLSTIERKMTSPSAEPSGVSTARSGCGIIPRTFRSRLQIPAMPASDPFGFASGSL